MANSQRAGYGCRQTMTVGNTPATGGQSEFLVQPAATTITMQKGNPISMQTAAGNGSLGFVMDAAQNTMSDGTTGGVAWTTALPLIQGVFNGATFVDPTGKPTWTNGLAAGQLTSTDYNTGSANITAFANTNPNQEYTVRCAAGQLPMQSLILVLLIYKTRAQQLMDNHLVYYLMAQQLLMVCGQL